MRKIFTILFVLSIYTVNGQIITDRPDQTESPITVPNGGLQIESGILLENTGTRRDLVIPTTLLRVGLGKSFELRLQSEYQTYTEGDDSRGGIGDIQVGAKVWLSGGLETKTNIGWITHFILPSGSKGFSDEEFGVSTVFSFDHDLGGGLGLGYNLGYRFEDESSSVTYTMALGYDLNSKVGIYVEPYGAYNEDEEGSINVNAGFTYLFNPNTQFDFSFGTGVNERFNYLSLGMSWLIK